MLYDVYHKDSNVVWRLSKILMLYDVWRLYHKDSNVVCIKDSNVVYTTKILM